MPDRRFLVVLLLLLWSLPGWPQPPTPAAERDALHLRNGAIVRGDLLPPAPDGRLRLRTLDGRLRHIAPEDVRRRWREIPPADLGELIEAWRAPPPPRAAPPAAPGTLDAAAPESNPPWRPTLLLFSHGWYWEDETTPVPLRSFFGWGIGLEGGGRHSVLRLKLYRDRDEQNPDATLSGVGVALLATTNGNGPGFNVYLGGVLFRERFAPALRGESDTVSGFAIALGLSYRWRRLVADLHIDLPDPTSYRITAADETVSIAAFALGWRL